MDVNYTLALLYDMIAWVLIRLCPWDSSNMVVGSAVSAGSELRIKIYGTLHRRGGSRRRMHRISFDSRRKTVKHRRSWNDVFFASANQIAQR